MCLDNPSQSVTRAKIIQWLWEVALSKTFIYRFLCHISVSGKGWSINLSLEQKLVQNTAAPAHWAHWTTFRTRISFGNQLYFSISFVFSLVSYLKLDTRSIFKPTHLTTSTVRILKLQPQAFIFMHYSHTRCILISRKLLKVHQKSLPARQKALSEGKT